MRVVLGCLVVLALAACAQAKKASAEEEQAARETTVCVLDGQRFVVRITEGEARMLMPGGDRIVLYQIASASGLRFSNGMLELRGGGLDWQLVRDGVPQRLGDCKPYEIPVAK